MKVKRQTVTARVETSTKQELRNIADRERRTVSQVVELLIYEALQARQSKEQAA